jgi:hypothetical protein
MWRLPSREPGRFAHPAIAGAPTGDEETTKWLCAVNGVELLVCRYFAVRRRPEFHVPFARLAAEVRYPCEWPVRDPQESRRITEEMRELQANPPRRSDLVVFRPDLFSPRYGKENKKGLGDHGHSGTVWG